MKRFAVVMLVLLLTTMLLPGCAAPTPQVVEKVVTQVVTQEKVVEKQVIQTQVVEKQVEKVVEKEVTPTPAPTAAPQVINGWPAADANEAKTAQAAWDAADKGKRDPAWKR